MMTDRFQASLAETLRWEGGYSNDPADPGGPTMRGIIQREYDAWRDRQSLPRRSVKLIEDAEIETIYRTGYWATVRADELPAGVDLVAFDAAVNCGPATGIKFLQRALSVKADGQLGSGTMGAIAKAPPADLIRAAIDARRAYYRALKTFPIFGKGWLSRADGIQVTALKMVGQPTNIPVQAPIADADAQSASQGKAHDWEPTISTPPVEPNGEPPMADDATAPKSAPLDPVNTLASDVADVVAAVVPKTFLASLTMWGGVLGFAASVLPTILTVAGYGAASPVQTVIMGGVAAAMTFIGRINATQPLSLK